MAERIVFSLEQEEQQPKSALEQQRERHRQRAERFGTQYHDPAALPKFAQEARKERFRREGFATGIDLFSEEEIAKRAARAKKFGLPEERQAPSYAPDPEDLKREARAKKFGMKYEKPTPDTLLQKQDLFEPRKDAPEDVPRREVAIYLYGIDVMSTSDVLAYFDEYGPSLVEWINDSSCCVVFEDAATTRRAIAGCGHPLTAEELSTAPDFMDETMGELDAAASIPMLWHKGRDFIKHVQGKDVKIPLMYRMATDLDQKDPHAEKRSRYLWKGKRRRDDSYQEQQQQQGRGRGRGRGRQQHGEYEGDDWQEEGQWGEGYAEGDDNMQQQQQQGGRGGRNVRQRAQQPVDVDMHDAEEDPAAAAAAAGGGEELDPDAARDLREQLKQRDAARRAAEEDLPWLEVPQPEGDAAEEDDDSASTSGSGSLSED
uniref:Nuclear cap-binding protein subunit 3 n=1 Tax=Tetradesmus obliquus TaxID=3088 RepID=A0A383V5T6_TETOB|eukprot:jgi/Sobl393_1/3488/SZX60977.1